MKATVTRPCGNRYLIRLWESEKYKKLKESPIHIPKSAQHALGDMECAKREVCIAKVVQRGISCKIESDRKTLWANEGDTVLVNRYSWVEVPNGEEETIEWIINDEDILAIVEVQE